MISESQIIKNELDKLNKHISKGLNIFPLASRAKRIFIKNPYEWGKEIWKQIDSASDSDFDVLSVPFIFIVCIAIFIGISLIDLVLTPFILPIVILRRLICSSMIKGRYKKYISVRLSEYQSQGYDISELADIKELIK